MQYEMAMKVKIVTFMFKSTFLRYIFCLKSNSIKTLNFWKKKDLTCIHYNAHLGYHIFPLFNPNRAKIFSNIFHAGGGTYMTPTFSPAIGVIEGQTTTQIMKLWKKTKFEQFSTFFLPLFNGKTVNHTNASGRCIFHSINLKFYEKAKHSICNKICII